MSGDVVVGQDLKSRASRKRAYVTLIEDDDLLLQQENVVIGHHIGATAVERSDLLSGIEHTEGLASLPAELKPEDIQLWQAACAVDSEMPLDELVTVLKVSDALGDTDDGKWVLELAKRASNTAWGEGDDGGVMLCALFRLPDHLLRRVMARCRLLMDLEALLTTFPAPLHAAIAAAATFSGELALCEDTAMPLLAALPSTTLPPPGLQALAVVSESYRKHMAPKHLSEMPLAAAELLARAATAHPSLTCLTLSHAFLRTPWLRAFSACLAPGALPRLVELTLSAVAHPGGCAAVAATLSHLPALTSLRLDLGLFPPATAKSMSACSRLAVAPASLPHLQRLEYHEARVAGSARVAPSCGSSFIQLLSLPALTWLSFDSSDVQSMRIRDVGDVVARCPALKEVTYNVEELAPEKGENMFTGAAAAFPPLASLSLTNACPLSPLAVATSALAASRASLTSLQLCVHADMEASMSLEMKRRVILSPKVIAEAWSRFLPCLESCTGLQVLNLGCLVGWYGQESVSVALGSALSALTQLTRLSIQAREPEAGCGLQARVSLDGAVLGEALSGLSELQELALCVSGGARFTFDRSQPVLEACARLQKLKAVELTIDAVTSVQLTALLEASPALELCHVFEEVLQVYDPAELAEYRVRFSKVEIITSARKL